jgi:2-amino-4-hydroxy-6-hydroxymethyldihydropteridine diphosphokinase
MTTAAIGIGSNLDDPQANVLRAITCLQEEFQLVACSSLYRTKPWGVTEQPDFVNAAAIINVTCTPHQLLEKVKEIEVSIGRRATYRWGPRVIDLDILTFGDLKIDEPDLIIPHPGLYERAFVLAPLAEIDPSFVQALSRLSAESRREVEQLGAPALQE